MLVWAGKSAGPVFWALYVRPNLRQDFLGGRLHAIRFLLENVGILFVSQSLDFDSVGDSKTARYDTTLTPGE
jgi:hypothetical protein